MEREKETRAKIAVREKEAGWERQVDSWVKGKKSLLSLAPPVLNFHWTVPILRFSPSIRFCLPSFSLPSSTHVGWSWKLKEQNCNIFTHTTMILVLWERERERVTEEDCYEDHKKSGKSLSHWLYLMIKRHFLYQPVITGVHHDLHNNHHQNPSSTLLLPASPALSDDIKSEHSEMGDTIRGLGEKCQPQPLRSLPHWRHNQTLSKEIKNRVTD